MDEEGVSVWPAVAGGAIALALAVALWPRGAQAVTRGDSAYRPGTTGSEFLASLEGMGLREREEATVRAVAAGAVPGVFGEYVPVEVRSRGRVGVFWAAPWHLAVGTDDDPFHAPLTAPAAQRAADALGQALPTRAMVDAIRASGRFERLPFRAFPPSAGHRSPATYAASSSAIERDRAGRRSPLYGYAKDYVVTNLRRGREGRIGIYGGWDGAGRVIQQVEGLPHDTGHVDYSQKPRLVASVVSVDGVEMPLSAALADPAVAHLFSDEGAIPVELQRYPT